MQYISKDDEETGEWREYLQIRKAEARVFAAVSLNCDYSRRGLLHLTD